VPVHSFPLDKESLDYASDSNTLTNIPPIPEAVEGDFPSHRGALQRNSIASDCAGSQIVRLAASNAASAASIDWWRAPLRTKGGAVEALSLPGLVGSCPRGWCKSASLLASQPRIGRPPHLVTQCGLYPISRPIGRLFPHPALMFAFKGLDANIRFRCSGRGSAYGCARPETGPEDAG